MQERTDTIPQLAWGDKPSIHELNSKARREQVPQELLDVEDPLKGHPGFCAGRESELRKIATYFKRRWSEEKALSSRKKARRKKECVACMITNAPGSGKTTLVEEFMQRYESHGIACITLGAGDFEHDDKLIQALRDYARQQATGEGRADKQMTESPPTENGKAEPRLAKSRAEAIWHRIRAWAKRAWGWGRRTAVSHDTPENIEIIGERFGAKIASGPIAGAWATLQGRRQQLWERWCSKSPETPVDAFKLINEIHQGEFVVVVDECHYWAEIELAGSRVVANLQPITEPLKRKASDIKGGGAVLVGLGDTNLALEPLGLSRALPIWLGELDHESAATVIRRGIGEADVPDNRIKAVIEPWTAQLLADFSHWPQHCAAAGFMAAQVLEYNHRHPNPPASDGPEHLEWVRTLTARSIGKLYTERWNRSNDGGLGSAALRIVALANLTDNRIPREAIELTISYGLRELDLNSTENIQKVMRAAQRGGVLRPVTGESDEPNVENYFKTAIPSLRRYITEKADPQQLAHAYEAAKTAIASITGGRSEPPNNGDS